LLTFLVIADRESIFRWPFKNKMSLSKSHSMKEDQRRIEVIRSTSASESTTEHVDKIAHEMALAEKNERIKRSIYERLHSNNSVSMPDLVQRDDGKRLSPPAKMMAIQKGLEMSLEEESDEYQMIDDEVVQEIKPTEAFFEAQTLLDEEKDASVPEEIEEEISQARPPTPIRRRSRSNSIKNQLANSQPSPDDIDLSENANLSEIPPAVKPRKKHVLASNTIEHASFEVEENRRSSIDVAPKSILKNSETSAHSSSTVHFINVPESSSSEDEADFYRENENFSVWQQIDMHRMQLTKAFQLNNDDDSLAENAPPPPLPITPPPRYNAEERGFSFA
jgi:hypothetical protein